MPRAALVVVLVALAGCGGGDAPAAPKRVHGLYPAAGARLFLDCRGSGPRTVVLDSGLGVDSTSTWAAVRPAVARFARVWGRPDPRVERLWAQLQRANAARSPRGRVVLAPRSHHRIAEDQPELVIAAIRDVVGG
jgi:pimeloyl-ACP methyl ester carboxylesterase